MCHEIPRADRYPGARPFQDDDIDRTLFRGREREALELLHLVLAEDWVVLYGRSGVGKSSLLNAGVLAELRRKAHLPLRVRLNDPATGPLGGFLARIEEAARLQRIELIKGDADSLAGFFATAEFWAEDTLLTPVVVLDQFEELFTLHTRDQRRTFIDALAQALRGERPDSAGRPFAGHGADRVTPAVKFVCSIREDFLGDLEELAPKIPGILSSRFRLTPMRREAAARAIREPAALEDPRLRTRPFEYEPRAIDAVLDFLGRRSQADERAQGGEIEPFQLQIICRHAEALARAREVAGGPAVVIDERALAGEVGLRQVLERFYEDEVGLVAAGSSPKALFNLCERGLISARGRRLSLEQEEIETRFKVPPPVLSRLVDGRILRAEPRVGSVYYELSHDSLIGPILASRARRARARRSRRGRITNALTIALGLAIAAYYYAQLRPRDGITVSPDTTHIVTPLKPNGLPDYVAAFNSRYGADVTPESNAAVELLDVFGSMNTAVEDELRGSLGGRGEPSTRSARFVGGFGREEAAAELMPSLEREAFSKERFSVELTGAIDGPWSEHERPLVAAWLKGNEVALSRVRDAVRKPRYWIPASEGTLLDHALLNFVEMRNVGHAFCARAQWHTGRGEIEAAAEDLTVVLELARLLSRSPILLEKLIASALTKVAIEGLASLSSTAGLTRSEAAAVASRLHSIALPEENYKDVLGTAQRWALLDALVWESEWRRQGPGQPADAVDLAAQATARRAGGPGLYDSVPRWIVIDWDQALRLANRYFDAKTDAIRRDPAERERIIASLPKAWDAQTDFWRFIFFPRQGLARHWIQDWGGWALPQWERPIAQNRKLWLVGQLLFALAEHRAKTRGFPHAISGVIDPSASKELERDEVFGLYRVVYKPLELSGKAYQSFALLVVGMQGYEGLPALCLGPTGRITNVHDGNRLLSSEGGCPDPSPPPDARVTIAARSSPTWWSGYAMPHAIGILAGAGAVWWLRRRKTRFSRYATIVVLISTVFVALWPLDDYRQVLREQEALKQKLFVAIRTLEVKVAQGEAPGTPSSVQELQALTRVLPTALDFDTFVGRLDALGRSCGAKLVDARHERETRKEGDKHEEGRVWLEFAGPEDTLAAVSRRKLEIERLVHWREERRTASSLSASVQLFAMPAVRPPLSCEDRGSSLHANEVSQVLARCCATRFRRADLDKACQRLVELSDRILPALARESEIRQRRAVIERHRLPLPPRWKPLSARR